MQYHSQIYQKNNTFGSIIENTTAKSIQKWVLLAIISRLKTVYDFILSI